MTRFTVILTAIVTMMASPATSQSLGSHIKKSSDARSDIHDNDPNTAEKAVHFFARCTAELRSPVAKKILELPYSSREQQKLVRSKVRAGEECMDRLGFKLRTDHVPLFGGMAEYYVTDVFPDESIGMISSSIAEKPIASPTPRNSAEIFSQCVARKNPREVKDFNSTEPTGEAEKEVLQSVMPLLGQCIPAGENITLDKISLRAMLSFGLYRELASIASAETAPASASAGSQ